MAHKKGLGSSRNGRAGGSRPRKAAKPAEEEEAPPQRSTRRGRRRRAVADAEDDQTRHEAGLGDTPAGLESDPESDPAEREEPDAPAANGKDEAGEDGLQSKPRRRGRRGGRRRSAAKAEAAPE
jgi:ribonuclease G